uniref:UBA domain-containing protein n=1 Tax=Bursaphelenchus xylophilus TaxID=6326 RepID=A0A1I7S3Y7_BURXY
MVTFDVSSTPEARKRTGPTSSVMKTQSKTVESRIRFLDSKLVPVVANLFEGEKLYVLDDEKRVNILDLGFKESVDDGVHLRKSMDSGIIEGLRVVGNPMEVSMLDISGEKENLDGRVYVDGCNRFVDKIEMGPHAVLDGQKAFLQTNTSAFRCKLAGLTGAKALSEFNLIVLTDGSDVSNNVAYGSRVTKNGDSEISVKYLGYFDASCMMRIGVAIRRPDLELINVTYHGLYGALSESFEIPRFTEWPIPVELAALLPKEDDPRREENFSEELVRGSFKVAMRWKESEQMITQFKANKGRANTNPFKYFQTPNTTDEALLTISPGWLDPRVKDFARSMKLRFVKMLFDKSSEGKVSWPMVQVQTELVERFKTFFMTSLANPIEDFDVFEGSWDFFAAARSWVTLKEMMSFLVELIKNEEIKHTHVHTDGISQFASAVSKDYNLARSRLDESRVVEYLIQLGMDRIRRELLIELGNEKAEALSYLDLEDVDIEAGLQRMLAVHLALQTYDLCRKYIDNSAFVDKMFGTFLRSSEQVNFDNVKELAVDIKVDVPSLNRELFAINNLREWSVTCDFNDAKHGSNQIYVYLSRNPELRISGKLNKAEFRMYKYQFEVPDMASLFHTYLANVNDNVLTGPGSTKNQISFRSNR